LQEFCLEFEKETGNFGVLPENSGRIRMKRCIKSFLKKEKGYNFFAWRRQNRNIYIENQEKCAIMILAKKRGSLRNLRKD